MSGVFNVPWIRDFLGEERYQQLRATADGDGDLLRLILAYDDDLSSALQRDLRKVEMMLRNGFDRTMRMLWPGKTHWLMDPASYACQRLKHRYPKLAKRIRDGSATPGLLVSSPSFGFWRQLTSDSAEQPIFVPYLQRSFVAKVSRKEVDATLDRLVQCRNRAAHHESMLRLPHRDIVDGMIWLSERMLPPLASELKQSSETLRVLESAWVPAQRRSAVKL